MSILKVIRDYSMDFEGQARTAFYMDSNHKQVFKLLNLLSFQIAQRYIHAFWHGNRTPLPDNVDDIEI